MKRMMIAAGLLAALAGGGGYWLGRQAAPRPQTTAPEAPQTGKIAYYRNSMNPADTSPVPKKDAMGMDYVPVMADQPGESGTVKVSPDRLQMLGVRTAEAELRPALVRSIRATAVVQFDERHLAAATTKAEGWIEKLEVSATGDSVRRGQVLAWIYSPDLVAAEREYLVAATLVANGRHDPAAHGEMQGLVDASLQRLRALDVPEQEIARLRRSGEAARRIAVLAPADGVITEKPAIEGMKIEPGEPLYRSADLSDVWLIAEIQESDLGAIRRGQKVAAQLAAFPGRQFPGTVDFVYPVLNQQTRTARVRIVMPNPDRSLRADMYASILIETEKTAAGERLVAVPDSAIIDSGTQQFVLVDRGEGRFAPRQVGVGARGDGWVQVESGLQAGERVAVSANFLIDAESNLRSALQGFAPAPDRGGRP